MPTLKELYDENLTLLETAIGQKSPLNNKSFIRVLCSVLSLRDFSLYKFATERSLQNLATTATGTDLQLIGADKTIIRKPSVACTVRAALNATTGVTIPVTTSFTSPVNGLIYTMTSPAISVLGVATVFLTCEKPGVIGNLQIGDILNIVSPVSGAETVATVNTISTTGADEETEESFRSRVLFAQRSTTGGGNATDYKVWGESVAGVNKIYPYAGKPLGAGTSYPGDRTVYVEVDKSVDPDGVPSLSMLDTVRYNLNNDPITLKSRAILGITDSTLYVEAITRTAFNVEITGLSTPSGKEASVKSAILQALTNYFLSVYPFVNGVDLEQYRNDTITTVSVSEVINGTIQETGSSANSVVVTVGVTPYDKYILSPGELAKLGNLTYV